MNFKCNWCVDAPLFQIPIYFKFFYLFFHRDSTREKNRDSKEILTASPLFPQYVDDVVIGAPYTVTGDMLAQLRVDTVCRGLAPVLPDPETGRDPYAEPKNVGKFRLVDSGNTTTTEKIVDRIVFHR